jgi:hypothetical protein
VNARVATFSQNQINSKLSIKVENYYSRLEGIKTKKVYAILESQKYIMKNHIITNNFETMELADITRLNDLIKGKPVKFEKAEIFSVITQISEKNPVIA